MKKTLLLSLFILLLPIMVFAGDLSATASGATREEAEKNAYIELSKFINISVYDEQKLETYSSNSETSNSSFSEQAIQTTANNFIKTEKSFETVGDSISCTVTLLESTAPNYISLMSEYVTTITSLESSYDGSDLSFQLKKATILNILEEYRKYDNAKSILLALNKYNSDIVKPSKTSAIWNNEYQNIIIQYNNDLMMQRNSLDSLSNDELIQNQIDEINEAIAQSNYELKMAEQDQKSSMDKMIEQRQKEIDSAINNIMNSIINENAISAEILTQSIDIKELLENFNTYYDQYQTVNSQYSVLLEEQTQALEEQIEIGAKEIADREYLLSDLNAFGTPGPVAKAVRESEIKTYKATKQDELNTNIKIINDKFTPRLNELQASMLSILSTIDNKGDFLLTLNPTDVECKIDVNAACFYCTISGEDGYLPIDGLELKIPLASLDKKMDFNVNDRSFDASDPKQLKAYNDYTETVELYKKLMEGNKFLTYKFKLHITASTVTNRFTGGNAYNAKIQTVVEDIQVVRNDSKKGIVEGATSVTGVNSRISKFYEDFFNEDIPFLQSYYSPAALNFYKTKLGVTDYSDNDSSSISLDSPISSGSFSSSNGDQASSYNELGDPYSKSSGYTGPDKVRAFASLAIGGYMFAADNFETLSAYYDSTSTDLVDDSILYEIDLSLSAFTPSITSFYLSLSYVYRALIYQASLDLTQKTYYQSSFGAKLGANVVLLEVEPFFVSVIPYVGFNFGNEITYNVGAMAALSRPKNENSIGLVGLGANYTLTGDLANAIQIYLELGF